jgi:CRP/FNR family transcriptional regulator, cyclic AMP receptor protein
MSQAAVMREETHPKNFRRSSPIQRAVVRAGEHGPSKKVPQFLGLGSVFKELPLERRAQVEKRFRWRPYEAGECIVDYLDTSDDVFIIAEGEVRVGVYSKSGTVVTFADLGPGEIFGEYAAIDGAPRSARIEARGRCLIGSMSADAFRELLEHEAVVTLALLRKLVMRNRVMTTRVYEFSVLSVRNRVRAELLRMATREPVHSNSAAISPAPTNAEIASRTSTHREAVSREVKRLARTGIVERRGAVLWIMNIERLAALVHAETGE